MLLPIDGQLGGSELPIVVVVDVDRLGVLGAEIRFAGELSVGEVVAAEPMPKGVTGCGTHRRIGVIGGWLDG